MKKRALSLLLALVLCVGLLPMAASGLDTDDILALLPDDPGVPVMTDVTLTMFWERNPDLWIYSKTEKEVFSELEDLTHELIRGKNSDTEKAKAIYDWVSKNIKYDREGLHSNEFFYRCAIFSGIHTFARRTGVCGGYAELVALMSIIAGLPVTYVYGYVGSLTEPHAWNAIYADGRWIFFDTVITGWDLDADYLNKINRRMYEIRVFGRFNCRTYDKFYISEQRGFAFPEAGITPDLTNIEMDAFYNCQDIESVVIPKNITYCGNTVFRDCKNLKTIEFEEGSNPEMDKGAFGDTTGLETVIIPGSLKKLGDAMFEFCEGLKTVTLGDGVETISDYAFDCCKSLESITIPGSVKTIGNGAFYLCKSLKNVYVPASVTSIGEKAFLTYCPGGTTIYTEPGSYAETYAKENKIKVVTSGAPTPTPEPTPTVSFADVPADAWYAEPVNWAIGKGITNGTGNNQFSPEKTCNTAEILTFLWRACGSPKVDAANSFTDVADGAWYADAAKWAKANGMVSGSTLSPETPCTRASTVMYIWQAMGKPAAAKAASFSDVPANADYAAAVAWAVEKGVTNGTGENTFSPDTICSRGHIVTFLQRAFAE